MTYEALYVLTDSSGFTTACAATRKALFLEAERHPLLSPIRIIHWLRTGDGLRHAGWKKASEWTWNGGIEVG